MIDTIPRSALQQHIAVRNCERCGAPFNVRAKYQAQRFCGRRCGLLAVNPPDHNARISRESAKARGDKQRGRGAGKTYPKLYGRHAHRTAAEQKLGRPLRPGELVHHEDENRANYAPDNLLVTDAAGHARIHFVGTKQTPEQIRKRVEATRRTKAARAVRRAAVL